MSEAALPVLAQQMAFRQLLLQRVAATTRREQHRLSARRLARAAGLRRIALWTESTSLPSPQAALATHTKGLLPYLATISQDVQELALPVPATRTVLHRCQ